MPYVQITPADQAQMLKVIGKPSVESLFESLPRPACRPVDMPRGMSELELAAHLTALAAKNRTGATFLGAGAYDHFIPTVVDHLASRAEFYTAYTPYQAEASQGTLQAIFEFQTLICQLTGMDISNASHYDGATAMVEAVLMATAATGRRTVLVGKSLHPQYRKVLATYVANLDVELVEVPIEDGVTSLDAVARKAGSDTAAVVFQTPNFFGVIEDGVQMAKIAHDAGALLIPVVDPISLGLLKSPGEWGADIVVGEGQSLGNPLSFGGPYVGFMGAREEFVRRMPGRIAGQTVDAKGRRGFVLTFQTREQHIRRYKATSNICTNEGLAALRCTIYMSAVGREGLGAIARLCLQKAHYAARRITGIDGYEPAFAAPFFKEFAVRCPRPVSRINKRLARAGMVGGYDLGRDYPKMKNTMLLCVTEKRTKEEIDKLVTVLEECG